MNLIALKEWEVAVRAMEQGRQDVIFRKGGIQEPQGNFQLTHNQFLLYPAHEHQKQELVRPEFHQLFDTVNPGFQKQINSFARVIQIHKILRQDEATPFAHRHIWTDQLISNRLDYKPDLPLYLVELEIHQLPTPIIFTETTQQAGCKSWVEVESEFDPFASAGATN